MSVAFSNASLARFAALLGLGSRAAIFGKLGFVGIKTPAILTLFWAGAVAHVTASLTFYVAFGLLTTVWFGWLYFDVAAVWGEMWRVAIRLLGREWLTTLGVGYALSTSILLSWALPKTGKMAGFSPKGDR